MGAAIFGIPGDPGRIAFQLNATHALNTALYGFLHPGDRVVRTQYDHNAVRRPVAALTRRGVQETVLSGNRDGRIDLDEAERAVAGDGQPARLLVVPHVSNVLGTVLPVRELAERARAHGARLLLDAAQSAGHIPIDVERLGVDLLAFTGHKGLLGPQGIGGIWVREGIEIEPLLQGGTGGDSADERMPAALPDRLEAGTQNGPGIAGLLAAVEWLRARGIDALHARESALKARLLARLSGAPGLSIHSPAAPAGVGIVTLTIRDLAPGDLALRLEQEFGVLTRAGLHCAPETHAVLGTSKSGAVRLSIGWATTAEEIDRTAEAILSVCGNYSPAGTVSRGELPSGIEPPATV